jgi:hypothetical protein
LTSRVDYRGWAAAPDVQRLLGEQAYAGVGPGGQVGGDHALGEPVVAAFGVDHDQVAALAG